LLVSLLEAAGWKLKKLLLQADEGGQVHADMRRVNWVKENLQPGSLVLAVGSGSVTDITKHACFLYQQETNQKLPFVVYQTANSVTAFTSNQAVLFVDGVKRTQSSRYPDVLICDLETLRDAPYEMTVGGVGDLLARYVSIPDWYLAYRFGMDSSYTDLPKQMLGPLDEILLAEAQGIKAGALQGSAILAKLIALAGLAMSLCHATTPLSGYEHVMSHILDMQAEFHNLPLAQHGTQVALASLIGVEVYRRFLQDFDPLKINLDECYPSSETMRKAIEQAFSSIDPTGKVAAECFADYSQKLETWRANRGVHENALRDWPAIRHTLQNETAAVERLKEILQAVDSPLQWSELSPPVSEGRVKTAFLNAPLMRKRLTMGDLLIFFNWDRQALWNEVWSTLGTI